MRYNVIARSFFAPKISQIRRSVLDTYCNNDYWSNAAIRELTQQDGWMTKKCGPRLRIPNLTQHLFVILPSWVFQPSCCVSSLLLEREKGKQLLRPVKLIGKRFRALWYFFNEYGKTFNCVNNKMVKYDWLLTGLIYGLIGCFSSKLSDYEHLWSDRPNRTVKQQIKMKHFMPLVYKH